MKVSISKTKDEFIQWLESLPPDTEFCQDWRIDSCPIAKFTGIQATIDKYSDHWVNEFMRDYDLLGSTSLQVALEIARKL